MLQENYEDACFVKPVRWTKNKKIKKYNPYLNVKVFRPNTTPLPYNPGGL